MRIKTRKYACSKCGYPIEVLPPDDKHTEISREPCKEGDSVEQPYKCTKCGETTKFYWDTYHGGEAILFDVGT